VKDCGTVLRVRSLAAAGALAVATLLAPALRAQAAPDPAEGPNAVLRPGDMVRLKIWREPEMSGDYRVDESGMVVFPRLGPVAVGRISTDSLRTLLVSIYSAQLRNPSIEVTVLRRVNVLGAVRNPGLYHVDPTMTVADVMALAGGVNTDGNPNRVELVRQGRRVSVRLSQQSLVGESPIRSGDQLWVPERSWLARNATVVAAAVTATALIVTTVITLNR
jgi:protein involved in polysaccharide export with SLBB domain